MVSFYYELMSYFYCGGGTEADKAALLSSAAISICEHSRSYAKIGGAISTIAPVKISKNDNQEHRKITRQ